MKGLPPRITSVSRPFWDGLSSDQIVLQHCAHCVRFIFYPRTLCPHCGSRSLTWRQVDDLATLYTWTIAEVPVSAAFDHLARPVLAVAEISGVHIPTTLIGAAENAIAIGMRLAPSFDHESYDGVTLLHFKPVEQAEPNG